MKDTVIELMANVDDMTAEQLGFALEILMDEGALDCWMVAAVMKKSRPGTIVHVLCHEDKRDHMVGMLFKHTTTLGVRECVMERYKLTRRFETVETPYGPVGKKISTGYGTETVKLEYEDLKRIAVEQGMSIAEVKEMAGRG